MRREGWGVCIFCAAAVILLLASVASSGIADCLVYLVGGFLRAGAAALSSRLPIPLSCLLGCLLLLFLTVQTVNALCAIGNTARYRRGLMRLLAVPALLLIVYAVVFFPGYRTVRLEHRLSLGTGGDADAVYAAAVSLLRSAEEDAREIDAEDTAHLPSCAEMARCFAALGELLPPCRMAPIYRFARVRAADGSSPLARAGMIGASFPAMGDLFVLRDGPYYLRVFTAYHEFAHLLGYFREDEAGFVAYLALAESEKPALRYAGSLGAYEYLAAELYRLDPKKHALLAGAVSERICTDLAAGHDLYGEREGTALSHAARPVHDAWLNICTGEGEESYFGIVRLIVAFEKEKRGE